MKRLFLITAIGLVSHVWKIQMNTLCQFFRDWFKEQEFKDKFRKFEKIEKQWRASDKYKQM